MLPTRDPSQDKRPTKTECAGRETNLPSKWTGKKERIAIFMSDNLSVRKMP